MGTVFTGAGAGYIMMVQEEADLIVKVLSLLSVALVDWSGCTGTYDAALSFRGQVYDTWVGCVNKHEYYGSIFIFKAVQWGFLIGGALLAHRFKNVITALSVAMLGADLKSVAFINLVEDM